MLIFQKLTAQVGGLGTQVGLGGHGRGGTIAGHREGRSTQR